MPDRSPTRVKSLSRIRFGLLGPAKLVAQNNKSGRITTSISRGARYRITPALGLLRSVGAILQAINRSSEPAAHPALTKGEAVLLNGGTLLSALQDEHLFDESGVRGLGQLAPVDGVDHDRLVDTFDYLAARIRHRVGDGACGF